MGLKQKTITGLTWSFTDNFVNQGINFIVGIILARLLTPHEFGLIGMLTIFIAISQSIIDGGFSQALIRKKDCTKEDYSTVFYFNFAVGIVLYIILFISAGTISNFFNEPQLLLLVRILGLNLIINSIALIQRTILIKNINFKLQTKISVIASIISGIVGIGMAYYGYGVWSLVGKTLLHNILTTGLLWIWNRWNPILIFSLKSFREMFSFGSKLLISGILNTIHINVYSLIIGKYFSASELGYYTRAQQFTDLPSTNITNVIQRVSYPSLSSIQDDQPKLKEGYKKLIKSTMLISFVLMMGMAAVAKPMVLTLIGEQWLSCVPYLQLLCFVAMLYPLHALNLNMLNVKGRSDLFLKLEIIKKFLAIPTIVIGIYFGVKVMIIMMIVNSVIAHFLNSYWSGKMVDYPIKEQVLDIAPSFIIGIIMGAGVFIIGYYLTIAHVMVLLIQILFGGLLVLIMSELIKLDAYLEIKYIILNIKEYKQDIVK